MSSLFKIDGSPNWYIEYRVPGRHKPVRRSTKTTDQKRAERIQAEIDLRAAKGTLGMAPRPRRTTLSGLLKKYQANPPKKHSAATVENYARAIKYWNDWGGSDSLSDIVRLTLDEFARSLSSGGLRPASINTIVNNLKSFVGCCAKLGFHTADNPFQKWEPLRAVPRRKRPLTKQQIADVLAAADTDTKLTVALGYYTGMRIGEILAAEWSWVDWDAKSVSVMCSPGFRTKSGKDRTIPLNSTLRGILEEHRRDAGYIVRHDKANGKYKYRWNWRKPLTAAAKAAGVGHVNIHLLRHTFVSVLLQAGVSETKVRRWAGHADRGITSAVYGHLLPWDAEIDKL